MIYKPLATKPEHIYNNIFSATHAFTSVVFSYMIFANIGNMTHRFLFYYSTRYFVKDANILLLQKNILFQPTVFYSIIF